jgi:tellurite resistance protein TerA
MTVSLVKGQKADLTKSSPSLSSIVIGMGWEKNKNNIDVDFSAFLLSGAGKVNQDEDLIYYSNPVGPNGCVSVLKEGVADNAQLSVNLRDIPPAYERIAFAFTIHDAEKRRQNFSLLDDTYIRIIDSSTGAELVRYNIGKSFSVETAIVAGELYRYNGDWKFNAIGAGYSGGLASLCSSYGIQVTEEVRNVPQAASEPKVTPTPTPLINLTKIELKKKGDVINLQKGAGPFGEILVNLNWNQKKSIGFFGSKGVDLDLACLFELKDGKKGAIQALGDSFGDLNRFPYICLDGDDRTGSVTTGENLRINGKFISEIKRVVVFAFIYEGVTNWSEAEGVVTITQGGGPDIEVRLNEHDNRKGMCAIAMITSVNDQTFSIERLVEYFSGHQELDEAYKWGLRWVQGSK